MKHLQLFENWLPKHDFTGLLMDLRNLVWDYKQNPNMGSYKQVEAIKAGLAARPELVDLTQQCIMRHIKHDDVVVFRGGDSDSDAGWSTELDIALRFAGTHNRDLNVGLIKTSEILYWDKVFAHKLGLGMDENEIITRQLDSVEFLGSVDVESMMEALDDDDSYDTLGYVHDSVETEVTQEVLLILKECGAVNKQIGY